MEAAARSLLDQGASRLVAWKKKTTSSPSPSSTSTPVLLFSSFSPPPTDAELSALEKLFEDRDAAIRAGIVLEGKRFEVRRRGREQNEKPENPNKKLDFFFRQKLNQNRSQKRNPSSTNQVHRHHPPLVYGREMGTEPARAEGAAVCCFEGGGGHGGNGGAAAGAAAEKEEEEEENEEQGGGTKAFAAITYGLPHVSARMVPLLQGFCGEVFGGGKGGGGGGRGGGGSAA